MSKRKTLKVYFYLKYEKGNCSYRNLKNQRIHTFFKRMIVSVGNIFILISPESSNLS